LSLRLLKHYDVKVYEIREVLVQAFLIWTPHSRCGGCGKRVHLLTQPMSEPRLFSHASGSVVTIQTELYLKAVNAKKIA